MLRHIKLAFAIAIAAAALAVAASPAAAHRPYGGTTQCGDGVVNGSGWFELRATNTSCTAARNLADHYVFEAGGNDDGFRGWSCDEIQIGDEVWKVKCIRHHRGRAQHVRFNYGA